MKRNSILFVIALVAAMAMMGNASADPAAGEINSSDAAGNIVTLYLDVNPSDYVTVAAQDGSLLNPPQPNDYYYFSSLAPLLDRNGFSISTTDPFNATIEMRCSGTERDINGVPGSAYTNTLRNTTPTTAHIQGLYDGALDWASILEQEPCPEPTYIDLNVSEISINPSCGAGTLRANTTNEICAKIVNDGTAAAGQFDVSFVVTGSPGGYSNTVTVTGGLGAGQNTTVCITNYQPTSPGAVTINVTADCNLAVGESDEGNNSMEMSTTVYNNGYMGKRLTGGEDINLVTKVEGNIDLKYAVCNATTYVDGTGTPHDFGDNQTYLSGSTYPNWTEYRARWDNNPQLPIPTSGETIKSAKLYVYYSTSYYPVPDLNVSFNGMNYTTADAVSRTDVKGWPPSSAYSNAPSGMLTYNVTGEFDSTPNTMVVYNLLEPGPDKVTLQGAVLAVIYEHSSEPQRIIYVNEGFDLLASTYYSCCTPDEATAYADFHNVIDTGLLKNATLITIATGATKGPGDNKLFFNSDEWDGGLKNGTFPTDEGWAPPAVTSWMDITANETDVLGSLQQGTNTAKFQDSGDLFCMANAILKLEKRSEVVVKIEPTTSSVSANPGNTTVNITLCGITDYGSGTIDLCYDNSIVNLVAVGLGDSTDVTHNSISCGGGVCERISASNTDGLSGDVVFANVTFAPATGVTTGCTDLNLTVITLYDRSYTALQNLTQNGTICVKELQAPQVTACVATPPVILNDTAQMRGRKLDTNVTNLTVNVADATSVEAVYVNLTPILGNPAVNNEVKMTGPDGSPSGVWHKVTNASFSSLTPYCLTVMAVDFHGNWDNTSCITLEVQRRGDVKGSDADNKVTGKDYYRIARWTVGLDPEPNTLRGNVVPAESWNGIDMADALYIAMYVVGNEDEP